MFVYTANPNTRKVADFENDVGMKEIKQTKEKCLSTQYSKFEPRES